MFRLAAIGLFVGHLVGRIADEIVEPMGLPVGHFDLEVLIGLEESDPDNADGAAVFIVAHVQGGL
ncbi:hypothetical protein D3C77_812160 [compost metagenome]